MRFILAVAGIVIVGVIGVWLIKAVLGLLGYLIVGALVVGGGIFIAGRVRRGLASGKYRRLTR
jgi:hypothetical protein